MRELYVTLRIIHVDMLGEIYSLNIFEIIYQLNNDHVIFKTCFGLFDNKTNMVNLSCY